MNIRTYIIMLQIKPWTGCQSDSHTGIHVNNHDVLNTYINCDVQYRSQSLHDRYLHL